MLGLQSNIWSTVSALVPFYLKRNVTSQKFGDSLTKVSRCSNLQACDG